MSNEVGGDLIGNAWWSGVRLADILAEAGLGRRRPTPCSRPPTTAGPAAPRSSALTDDRNAMLAVYMNGEPLPIEHGFPVRTLVPGLYGYVSACKWVVDMEVTTFDGSSAFWTDPGWSEQGPVKIVVADRRPRSTATTCRRARSCVAGMAWKQHTGIAAVEVSLDGGDWTAATLGGVPSDDTWVQWRAEVEVDEGDH